MAAREFSPSSPSLHTHSPALLRAAISSILDRHEWDAETENVVVSHPPSPTILQATFDQPSDVEPLLTSCRPLNLITPLDPNLLDRIPLSTPPKTPPPAEEAREWKAGEGETNYPLIVVTGGSGFIGSHTVLEILQEGIYGVVVLDNLENSHIEVLHRVRILAAQHHISAGLPSSRHPPLYFHHCDVQDRPSLASVFALYALTPTTSRIFAAIHFAALKSVSGSLRDPLSYYQINVGGTLNLAAILQKWGVKRMVFSSSCVVYGAEADGEGILEEQCDVREGASKGITNPYGRTKRMCEEILSDLSAADPDWFTMSLRYTNPSGAHPSGYIGEDPTNAANLMPIVTQVLQRKREFVKVFGADYSTPDGTGMRDFIHVVDLAKAHLAAIRYMAAGNPLTRNSTYKSVLFPL
ncbi:UDP-glucose 4-epimerase, partial [Phenoliferia sp. Uapishka_3]